MAQLSIHYSVGWSEGLTVNRLKKLVQVIFLGCWIFIWRLWVIFYTNLLTPLNRPPPLGRSLSSIRSWLSIFSVISEVSCNELAASPLSSARSWLRIAVEVAPHCSLQHNCRLQPQAPPRPPSSSMWNRLTPEIFSVDFYIALARSVYSLCSTDSVSQSQISICCDHLTYIYINDKYVNILGETKKIQSLSVLSLSCKR